MGKQQDLTIGQAAKQLGVSSDTIKRRIKRGEYSDAYREPTPQGFRWKIPAVALDLDDDVASDQDRGQNAPGSTQTGDQGEQDLQVTQQLIDTLQRELDIRNREIERLHIVVAQQSAAIQGQAATIAALPAQVPDQPDDDVTRTSDQVAGEAVTTAPVSFWGRLWRSLTGQT